MRPEDLRVPLSALPGFDPTGLVLRADGPAMVLMVHSEDPNDLLVAHGITTPYRFVPLDLRLPEYTPRAGWLLDLSDASTRDRVARWSAGRVGLEVGCTAPMWRGITAWARSWGLEAAHSVVPFSASDRITKRVVPTLADLDPYDSVALPDGSRVVDAVALGRVAVHLGRTP